MASRQEKLERAEAAARIAASDLRDINRETEDEQAAGVYQVVAEDPQHQEESPGVIGSVLKAVTGTLGHAKEAVVGKSDDEAAATRGGTESAAKEAKDRTVEKAKEAKEYTAEKAKAAKEKTVGKAEEYKDYAAEKARDAKESAAMQEAGEYKDYTNEKATEGKDATVGKLGELKDSAADAARKAMDFLTGKKEEAKQETAETVEAAKEKLSETEEAARLKMEELKMKGEEYREEAADHRADEGGIGRRDESDKAEIKLEETRPGAVAATLKAADQMTGQAFNDVGRMDDEGIVRLDRKERPGK